MSTNGSPPTPPSYTDLATQTAASNAAATQAQTVANRPNQVDQQGNTSTWTQDPTTGQWTQKIGLGTANQGIQDQQDALRGNLMGQATTAMGGMLDPSTLQSVQDPNTLGAGNFNMDPVGNSKAIQDATYALMSPQRQELRQAEIQRLKNQGLTEDSEAFQRGMRRLDTGDTDAQLKALLAGQAEYGAAFNRGASANNQNFTQKTAAQTLAAALRGQQLNEKLALRNAPIDNLTKLLGVAPTPQFGQFMGAGNPGGVDLLSAGQSGYNALLGGYNAESANSNNMIGGGLGLLGGLLGAPEGSSGNDLVNWFTDLFKTGP